MPSRSQEEALARFDGLLQLALRLALSTPSGRIVLAKAAANIDPAWIPGGLHDSLGAALRRAASFVPEPLSLAEVESILTSAWGVRRVGDELDSLAPDPVAVTFTSQVHRGVRDGAPVAVKVLRPGVAAAFGQDLAVIDTLLAPLRGAFPGIDPAALLAELRERVMDELDLEHEAALMRRVSRATRGGPVVVPSPMTDLCRETVLVSSWLEGEPLSGGVGCGHDSTAAALLQFVIGGLREGLVHCDLDADDVLALADGRTGVVDFGAVAAVPRECADACLAAFDAFVAADAAAFDAAVVALGLLEPGHGETALGVATVALGPLAGTGRSRLDAAAVADLRHRLDGLEAEALELLAAAHLRPSDLYPARGLGQLFSLIARLGASGTWRDQVRSALRDGWSG